MSSLEKEAIVSKRPLSASISRWFGKNLIRIYMALAFIYLFIPVAYTIVFSFND